MYSKSFKFFNVIQIILFFVFAIGALGTAVFYAGKIFGFNFFEFINQYAPFVWMSNGRFVCEQFISDANIINIVLGAFSLLFFVWSLIVAIRLINYKKYYKKFHVVTLIFNILFVLVLEYNAFLTISKLSVQTNLISFIINIAFVLLVIFNLIMTIVGMKHSSDNIPHTMQQNGMTADGIHPLANQTIGQNNQFLKLPNGQVVQNPNMQQNPYVQMPQQNPYAQMPQQNPYAQMPQQNPYAQMPQSVRPVPQRPSTAPQRPASPPTPPKKPNS